MLGAFPPPSIIHLQSISQGQAISGVTLGMWAGAGAQLTPRG